MEAYPKPRHQYIYTPRYGQRGFLSYAGQTPNSAPITGVIPNGGYGSAGVGVGMGVGMGVGVGVATGGYYPGRSYYNTASSYGYSQQAYVYPPGPSATTTTTTYHVTNSHAGPACAPAAAPCNHGPTREDIQLESRRVATERGSYNPRRIKPADARSDDPFWCRERNGEWHLRTYYQIENECHPGSWKMDAEAGFLVFHRE